MNIIVSSKYFYPPFGGGEISLYNLLREMSVEHRIHVLYANSFGQRGPEAFSFSIRPTRIRNPFIRGYTIRMYLENLLWQQRVFKELKRNKYDLLITQLEFSAPSIIAASKLGVPSCLFIRSYEYFCIYGDSTCELKQCFQCLKRWKDKIEYPFAVLLQRMMRTAYNRATFVVANSQFTADKCSIYYSRKVNEVIYSIGYDETAFEEKQRCGEFITLITPTKLKGVDIFLHIARKMPNLKFLAVGRTNEGTKEQLRKLSNMTYMEWTDDKEKYLSKSSVILVPSLCEDTFPRVCLEALSNGIPCIGSNKGGIPEALGNAGILIDDPHHIQSWIHAINRVLSDEEFRRALIREGYEQVKKFSREESMKRLNRLLDRIKSKKMSYSSNATNQVLYEKL